MTLKPVSPKLEMEDLVDGKYLRILDPPSLRQIGKMTYQSVTVITGQDQHINWRRVIGYTDSALWTIFHIVICDN